METTFCVCEWLVYAYVCSGLTQFSRSVNTAMISIFLPLFLSLSFSLSHTHACMHVKSGPGFVCHAFFRSDLVSVGMISKIERLCVNVSERRQITFICLFYLFFAIFYDDGSFGSLCAALRSLRCFVLKPFKMLVVIEKYPDHIPKIKRINLIDFCMVTLFS